MMTLVFGTVLPWMLLGAVTWLGYQLVRQNGRILLRLEAIEKRLGARPAEQRRQPGGLTVGTLAPDFELPDFMGQKHKLSEFRGKDVLLIFFNPKCGFCTKMAADLAALPIEGGGERAMPLLVTTGDANENRKLVEQHGIRCTVLLQEQIEVVSQYRAQGTPMGYRIDAGGRIASELAVGAEPLLQLAATPFLLPKLPFGNGRDRETSVSHEAEASRAVRSQTEVWERGRAHGQARSASGNGAAHQHKQPDPSLARSRLNRNGLKSGATAPEFTLPRVDGGELSLADLRGGRVLLVFSDPNCGPCDELAPRLQELHLTRPDLQVLVISRRDANATRAKAESLGLTYPIVMQKQWELSMKYGMFATPIGYLIDREGVLLSDVAVGVEPILQLADASATPMREHAPSRNGTAAVV
jgi:peroxiredoxin